jgi:hypothetical protein
MIVYCYNQLSRKGLTMVVQLHPINSTPENEPSVLRGKAVKAITAGAIILTCVGGYRTVNPSNVEVYEIDIDGDGKPETTVEITDLTGGELSGGQDTDNPAATQLDSSSGEDEEYVEYTAEQLKTAEIPSAFFDKSQVIEDYLSRLSTTEQTSGIVEIGKTHTNASYGKVVSARIHEETGETVYAVFTGGLTIYDTDENGKETGYIAAPHQATGKMAYVELSNVNEKGNVVRRPPTPLSEAEEGTGSFEFYQTYGDPDSGQEIIVRPDYWDGYTGHYISTDIFEDLLSGQSGNDFVSYVEFFTDPEEVELFLDKGPLSYKDDESFIYRWEDQVLNKQSSEQ